ncbi:MAG: PepSY domain-containing protein [Nitrososphaeraceae archaeon]
MKIVLAITTTLTFVVAMGIVGISNNNSNTWNAFAQVDPENPPMMDESTAMTMSNQSEPKMNWTGTVEVESTIVEAFKSKVNVDIIEAIKAAQGSVGLNSTVKEAELTHAHNYLIYKVTVLDEDMKKYKVIVDPGNGKVLLKKEITWYDEHKMKYCEDKGDKYGYDYKMKKDSKY